MNSKLIGAARKSFNQATTKATATVAQDWKPLPVYSLFHNPSELVSPCENIYRSTILNSNSTPEYAVWPINNTSLTTPTLSETFTEATGILAIGNYVVADINTATRSDGSRRIFFEDTLKRDILDIISITIVRGDNDQTIILTSSGGDFTYFPSLNKIELNNTLVTQDLGVITGNPPCISSSRGDEVISVSYTLSTAKFNWSRNDTNRKRFQWDGKSQYWKPLVGGTYSNLGKLKEGKTYQLPQPPVVDNITGYLLGDILYSQLRLGPTPSDSSILLNDPIGIVVIQDSEIEDFDFSSYPTAVAYVSLPSSILVFKESFVSSYVGLDIWYDLPTFGTGTGIVGSMLSATTEPLFISPIPLPDEYPLISFGSRSTLRGIGVFNDTELSSVSLSTGEFAFSHSSGRLKFFLDDLNRSDPQSIAFDRSYFQEDIVYSGVVLNSSPCSISEPVILSNNVPSISPIFVGADLYIPDATFYESNRSGILHILDKTGAVPKPGIPSARIGGDNQSTSTTGLVRSLGSDYLIYCRGKSFVVNIVDLESQLPKATDIPSGEVYISLEMSTHGSLVRFSRKDSETYSGNYAYFLQPNLLLSKPAHGSGLIVSSSIGDIIRFDDLSAIEFEYDSNIYSWTPTQLVMSLSSVVNSLNAVIGSNVVSHFRGHLLVQYTDIFEISPNSYQASKLGFHPGLIISKTVPEFDFHLDSGLSFSLTKTFDSVIDLYSTAYYNQTTIVSKVVDTNLTLLPFVPQRDRIGKNDDQFYSVSVDNEERDLLNFKDVFYQFLNNRFMWLAVRNETGVVTDPVSFLKLQYNSITPFAFTNIFGNYLKLSSGSSFVNLIENIDFQYLNNGSTGTLAFTQDISSINYSGSRGFALQNTSTLTDLSGVNFTVLGVSSGNLLIVDSFVYRISTVSPTTLTIYGVFLEDTSGEYSIYTATEVSYDPSIVADVVWSDFQYLPEEPFKVRVFSPCGEMPTSIPDQITNRLQCSISEALVNNRPYILQYGLETDSPVSVYLIQSLKLGTIGDALYLSGILSTRYLTQSFSVSVGTTSYTHGVTLFPVISFSPTIPSGTIEYIQTTGELAFSSDILTDNIGLDVLQVEEFLPAIYIPSGSSEVNAEGYLNIGSVDLLSNQNIQVYFVEQYIAENRVDLSLSPLSGAIGFRKPLLSNQIVQARYFPADGLGDPLEDQEGSIISVIEYLPIYIQLETASRVGGKHYTFNPLGKTLDVNSDIVVYVGAKKQNFANRKDCVVTDNTILFTYNVPSDALVRVSYAVLECFGGETTFAVSTIPVYRKPLFLEKGQDTILLSTDRSSDLPVGGILNIGTETFYIKSNSYDLVSDITTVVIYPPATVETGSRTPGIPVSNRVSSKSLAVQVGDLPIVGNDSFWSIIADPFDVIRKNQTTVRFNSTSILFGRSGHILEIAGIPYIIRQSTIVDNRYTDIELVSFVKSEITSSVIRISVRPIYDDNTNTIQNLYPVYSDNPYKVFYLREDLDSGSELRQGIDYTIDTTSGLLTIKNNDYFITKNVTLYTSYTRIDVKGPISYKGGILYPKFIARYFNYGNASEVSPPTVGLSVLFTGHVYRPDTFFVAIQDVDNLAIELGNTLGITLDTPTNALVVSPNNRNVGTYAYDNLSQIIINDRVARSQISLYNTVVNSFFQLLEMINCKVVGGRDGYFKFSVGTGNRYTPPGYEDPISGILNPRNLFLSGQQDLISLNNPQTIVVNEGDFLYEPNSNLTLVSSVLSGDAMTTRTFNSLINSQYSLLRNDIDDRICIGRDKVQITYVGSTRLFNSKGKYDKILSTSLSRFFRKTGGFFLTTSPGVGDYPGIYTYSRVIDGDRQSTYRTVIGNINNPTLEDITNLSSVEIGNRYPRYRFFAYSIVGFPSLVPSTANIPSALLIATPVEEAPVDFTGIFDPSSLLSQGGTLPDIVTGNTDISLPGISIGDPVYFGDSTGNIYQVYDIGLTYFVGFTLTYGGVFIHTVDDGCIVTFRDMNGSQITDSSRLVLSTPNGFVAFDPQEGDTLLVLATSTRITPMSDPPTDQEVQEALSLSPNYRVGFDVDIDFGTGEILDITKMSLSDSIFLPIKEFTGQNPPQPLQDLEGTYYRSVANTSIIHFPALDGVDKNDSGDYSYPYVDKGIYEKKYLRELHDYLMSLSTDTYLPDAQYPFEIVGRTTVDNSVAKLQTTTVLTPVIGPYIPGSSLANARPYDLALIKVGGDSTIDIGVQGISSIADISESGGIYSMRFPRFVTASEKGTRIRYIADNIMVFTGLVVEEDGLDTFLYLPSNPSIYFNDGNTGGQGGLNHILAHPSNPFGSNENSITFSIINPISGLVDQTIVLRGNALLGQGQAISGLGTVNFGSPPFIQRWSVSISGVGFFNPALYGGSFPGTVGPFDFTVSVDTATLGPSGSIANKGSFTGYVDENRLTFKESYDLRNIGLRGSLTPGGSPIDFSLNLSTVTGKYSEDITVNESTFVNAGIGFTVLEVGTYQVASISGAGDEIGNIDMPSIEGIGNIPLSGSADFSIMTSTNNDSVSKILEGSGTCEGVVIDQEHQLVVLSILNGGVSNVKSGDILAITSASDATIDSGPAPTYSGIASVKCGTYIVRSTTASDNFGLNPKYRKVILSSQSGEATGWFSSGFPKITTFSSSLSEISVSTLFPFPTPSIINSPSGHAFKSIGRISILINTQKLVPPTTDPEFAEAIYSAAYASINTSTNTFQTLSDFRDGFGDPISSATFFASVVEGISISGMSYFPINIEGKQGISARDAVGIHDANTIYGFQYIRYNGINGPILFDASVGDISVTPAAAELGITQKTKVVSTAHTSYESPVFDYIPGMLDISNLTDTQWDNLHNPSLPITSAITLSCLLPLDTLSTNNGITEGFLAKAAIFLEPSVPVFPYDLNSLSPHIVDGSHTLSINDIRMRNSTTYGVSSPGSTDYVNFEVRRVRRFNESQVDYTSLLRACFEVRVGVITGYVVDDLQRGILTSSGTQFGGLLSSISNISAGDTLRLINDGEVVDSIDIVSVIDNTTLLLATPGIVSIPNPVGLTYEIYNNRKLIPHEQSFDTLISCLCDRIYKRTADFEVESGGYVDSTSGYLSSINILRDSSIDGVGENSYLAIGINVGDYLVIDPQGDIIFTGGPTSPESGKNPLGDIATLGRADYQSGSASNFDDNRGMYRVTEVYADRLVVTGLTIFTGTISNNIVFEPSTPNAYVVYPTIHGSLIAPSGIEGQNDLRPTSYRDLSNTYGNDNYSIAPFSYKIYRNKGYVGEDTIDLVFMQRERVKSLIQKLINGFKIGYRYWDLQEEEYLSDFEEGLPIGSSTQDTAIGLVGTTPYANSRSCLSLLDRRFWTKDLTLEGLYTDFANGIGLPVLPDRLSSTVNFEEILKTLRDAWIKYRIDPSSGTLNQISYLIGIRNNDTISVKTKIKTNG